LIALDASVRITDEVGDRIVPLGDFFTLPSEDVSKENILEPGEVVTEIILPPSPAGMKSSYRKVRERGAWDFALASVALAVKTEESVVTEANVVLGGVAPIPWRVGAAEDALVGEVFTPAVARAAADAAVEGADPMEQNAYKTLLVKGIVEESLLTMM
jgi:xanthine dehydrogenase YagS FAD-binding subunit